MKNVVKMTLKTLKNSGIIMDILIYIRDEARETSINKDDLYNLQIALTSKTLKTFLNRV